MHEHDLRTVVVDDEQLAREELCFLLQQLGGVEVVGQAGTASKRCVSSKSISPIS